MTVFSDMELKQKVDEILDAAHAEGEVRIRRNDGEMFALRAVEAKRSGLDVRGVETEITLDEIVQAVRDGRERGSITNR